MEIVEFFVRPDGVHVGVDAVARLYAILRQRESFPLGKRVDHLSLGVTKVFNGEGHGTLHAVKVVVDAESLEHKERSRDTAQPKLGGKVLLEKVLNKLDAMLGLFGVEQLGIVYWLNNFAHLKRLFVVIVLQRYSFYY